MSGNSGGAYEVINLDTLNEGQVVALFDRELKKTLENIADENTAAKVTRTITLTIKIKPEDDRGSAIIEVDGHSKLAPVKTSKHHAVLSFDGEKTSIYQAETPKQGNLGLEEVPGNERPFRQAAAGEGR